MPGIKIEQNKTVKITVNIPCEIKARIDKLVKQKIIKSQDDFINRVLQKALQEFEKDLRLKKHKD